MKKNFLAVLAAATLAFAPMATAQSIGDLSDGLQSFVETTPGALPFAATAGLDWSNAYMGQLIDLDFPFVHLGVGAAIGATTIPGGGVVDLLNAMGGDVPQMDLLPLPFAVVNARIGGLVLPFDIGVKVAFVPEAMQTIATDAGDINLNYQNFGFDVRYNLIKSDLLMPDISVGGSLNILNAGIALNIGEDTVYHKGSSSLTIGAPRAALDLSATTLEIKGQVSKTLLFIVTPYIGAGAMFGSAGASAGITSDISTTGTVTMAQWSKLAGTNLKSSGFVLANDTGTFGIRAFGGMSLNILVLKIDAQGMYNLTDGSLGGSLGARIQL